MIVKMSAGQIATVTLPVPSLLDVSPGDKNDEPCNMPY
jgi:hypothetical protein